MNILNILGLVEVLAIISINWHIGGIFFRNVVLRVIATAGLSVVGLTVLSAIFGFFVRLFFG